ncbi:hypothetical protein AD930_10890 [Acetobacter malorum]|nr:hypothetical protein AD930_10890 [Acetobacter malorum]
MLEEPAPKGRMSRDNGFLAFLAWCFVSVVSQAIILAKLSEDDFRLPSFLELGTGLGLFFLETEVSVVSHLSRPPPLAFVFFLCFLTAT